jgi:hypothetical protein
MKEKKEERKKKEKERKKKEEKKKEKERKYRIYIQWDIVSPLERRKSFHL